jgi:hemoglobin-like flavoprotein
MDQNISYKVVSRVLNSWELASQKYGSREEIGIEILLNVFRSEPETKTLFGFQAHQNIEDNPMLRMGVMVHGVRIFSMIDQVLSIMGPDMDSLIEFLDTLGERHTRHGVKKAYFVLLSDAVRASLSSILGDAFGPDDDMAWKELLQMLSTNITKNMVN